MKTGERGLGVLGAVAAGIALVGTLAVGCTSGGGNLLIPTDTIGNEEDDDQDRQTTWVQPAPEAALASLPGEVLSSPDPV